MDLLSVVILGIVEGISEFLPISSTGHLMLTAHLLGIRQTEFVKSFEIAIQLGAIGAVAWLYRNTLAKRWDVWKRVLIAFVPTACFGAVFYKIIKKFLLESNGVVLWSLFLGGIFLIIFELFFPKKANTTDSITSISYRQSFCIGAFQSISMVPGVSRAAATIIGGLSLGLARRVIVEFSFLLAIPTMLAATALDLVKSAHTFNIQQFHFLLAGFCASFVVAIIAVRFLLLFIKRHNFIPFGIYRIFVAILFWFILK